MPASAHSDVSTCSLLHIYVLVAKKVQPHAVIMSSGRLSKDESCSNVKKIKIKLNKYRDNREKI